MVWGALDLHDSISGTVVGEDEGESKFNWAENPGEMGQSWRSSSAAHLPGEPKLGRQANRYTEGLQIPKPCLPKVAWNKTNQDSFWMSGQIHSVSFGVRVMFLVFARTAWDY